MALRTISRSVEEIQQTRDRFRIAQDGPRPSPEQLGTQAGIASMVRDLAEHIDDLVEHSREKSLALTHLEEALMWTGKAIFRSSPLSQERT